MASVSWISDNYSTKDINVIDFTEWIFFELEVVCEFADGRLVLVHVSASAMFIVEFLPK